MKQDMHHTENFLKGLNALTGLPYRKIKQYAKTNNLFNILEHPHIMEPNEKQLEKIGLLNEFISSYNILKVYEKDDRILLNSSIISGNYFLATLGGVKDKEKFVVSFLDSGNNIIETKTMSEGTIGQAPVYPRAILKHALACDCSAVILGHNHPGGSREPSFEDKDLTQRIVDIFHPLEIKVLDHIIVAGNSYISMAEKGYLPMQSKNEANYDPIILSKVSSKEKQNRFQNMR